MVALVACYGGPGDGNLNAEEFQKIYDRFGELIERAEEDDIAGAEEIYRDSLDELIRIDDNLKALPVEIIARTNLLDARILIVGEFNVNRRGDFLVPFAEDIKLALIDAAKVLNVERPQ